jgi:hypothetical protein
VRQKCLEATKGGGNPWLFTPLVMRFTSATNSLWREEFKDRKQAGQPVTLASMEPGMRTICGGHFRTTDGTKRSSAGVSWWSSY